MKNLVASFLLLTCVLIHQNLSFASNAQHLISINYNLINELKLMCQKDQEVRFKVINGEISEEEISKVDQEHLPRLKNIIYEFGWPGFQLVGGEGTDCMWLLVQHCDQDIEFQKRCLALLEESVRKEDAPKKHLAYLTDRILIHEEQSQIYGTQVQVIDGQVIPFPLQVPAELDKRREEMGLESFEEYLVLIRDVYRL